MYDSHVIQELLLLQVNIELTDWPPRVPDMNPIENKNMCSEVKRTMQETWSVLPPKNSDKI